MVSFRKITAVSGLLTAAAITTFAAAARADFETIQRQTVIEQTPTAVEQQVVVPASPATVVRRSTIVAEGPAVVRSNYSKRLADMLDQINMAADKGWLTARQADYLRRWQADVAREDQVLRAAGNGMVRGEDVNQLERHVNSLAFVINHEISAGSSMAGVTQSWF